MQWRKAQQLFQPTGKLFVLVEIIIVESTDKSHKINVLNWRLGPVGDFLSVVKGALWLILNSGENPQQALQLPENYGGIMPAKAKSITQYGFDFFMLRFVEGQV